MASTRPPSMASDFPDVSIAYEHKNNSVSKPPPRLQPSPMPLQPVEKNCIPDPPSSGSHQVSPVKSHRRLDSSHSAKGKLGFVPITAPAPPMFTTDSPAKRHPFSAYGPTSMPQPPLFTTFSSVDTEQPQNGGRPGSRPSNDNFADFPEPSYGLRPPLKRTLMEAAPLKDRPAKKQRREESLPFQLPEPHEMPPIEDDGTKPPYSYATLIGMSILRAPNRRLTLAQIYKWISETFSFYRTSDSGWQNSIRHNLSLNKAFIKQERPKDDPGKGNYWAIEPGLEAQFLKDKPLRRATLSSIPLPPAGPQRDSVPSPQTQNTTTWRVPPPSSASAPQKTCKAVDLSSDATLPASDPALQEDSGDENPHVFVPPSHPPRSSPLQAIHSSPPIAPPRFVRQGTPPTPSRPVSSSTNAPRHRKRKSVTANDSGYFSSLESSVLRPNKSGHILTSDLDIEPPRIKRGRAEEEIARIRSSSHDISPGRPGISKDTSLLAGSSPLRGEYISMLPPPLTPAIKFKKPAKPPPSLSPNTNLRNHRRKIQQMVNSPIKHLGLTEEDIPWSPAFDIHDDTLTPADNFHVHFDIFADPLADRIATPISGSPLKASVKASRTDGAGSAENALTDITNVGGTSRLNTTPLTSLNKAKGLAYLESPSKMPDTSRFIDATHDDFFSFSLFDENHAEVDGVDLLQGFQKIGGSSLEDSKGRTMRPNMGHRNHTSLF
ncbi:transcriptional regulator family: Forkhead [Paecilomyces variotii]|nr:transcriptional regulator family: Forkhead [Paecilomyces variotii]KAJ9384501.1 transcriptional regulator family: Forkhead [Paecilomyces variotii]